MSCGVFPDACNVAKLKPIYKKKKRRTLLTTDLFFFLLIISKVTERRLSHVQINTFLSENNICII